MVMSVQTQHSMGPPHFNILLSKLCVLLTVPDMPTFHFLPPNQMLYSDLCYPFHMN